ncbi:MAG TPA: LCP family protein [Candidatus Eisenbacteria bacterium]|nr:LCP family protein [Candidatus Eisenbacteria bacterium]
MRKLIPFIILGILALILLIKFGPVLGDMFPTAAKIVTLNHFPTLKETNNKTNILLLGIGGGSHDGPNLTDTIMVVSLDNKTNKITLISIPRDLWIPDINDGNGEKINEVYADGQNSQNRGLLLAKAVVGKVTGLDIHYGFRLDFTGFVRAVNEVGGLDVTVDRVLDDYEYPISGEEDNPCGHTDAEITEYAKNASDSGALEFFPCRYKHLHFNTGLVHMDGETALEFVRSRHAAGAEGSDFARSARQQKVIEAFRNKIFSASTIFNPGRILNLYGIVKDSIDTDINQQEVALFLRLAPKVKDSTIETAVIDYGDSLQGRSGLLINPPISSEYHFASVLVPRIGSGKYTEIQQYVACEVTKGKCTVSPTPSSTP